jgi:hypothetical protein
MTRDKAKRAVITVGDGRGFVVEVPHPSIHMRLPMRVVITAAHCLPWFPPSMSFSHLEERTYQKLLGPLGSDPTVWGECFFVDPIADIAVIGEPDNQELSEEAAHFGALVEAAVPLSFSDCPAEKDLTAWMLSLEGKWFRCTAQHNGGPLWTTKGTQPIQGGMSGSPILDADTSVIGVATTAWEGPDRPPSLEGGPHPRPICDLPWRYVFPKNWSRLGPKPARRSRDVPARPLISLAKKPR